VKEGRSLALVSFACAIGAGLYLYFAPLVIVVIQSPDGVDLVRRVSAVEARNTFALLYGALGVFMAVIGVVGALIRTTMSFQVRWVSAIGLGLVAVLAFLATFGEPRISFLFVPAAILMFLSAGHTGPKSSSDGK